MSRTGVSIAKRHEAMRQCAERYQARFGKPLVERMGELLKAYPDVVSPNWISWEGHRFTNAANSRAFRRWLDVVAEAGKGR